MCSEFYNIIFKIKKNEHDLFYCSVQINGEEIMQSNALPKKTNLRRTMEKFIFKVQSGFVEIIEEQ